MRRRFTLAIVGVVAGALLVAGLGSFVLLTVQSRRDARREVRDLAVRVAAEAASQRTTANPTPALRPLQNFLRHTQAVTLVVVRSGGIAGALPPGVSTADVNLAELRAGRIVVGFHGRTAYAAAPFTVQQVQLAAVAAQRASGAGGAGLYLLLAGGGALVVAFGVAETLARRIARPLVTVQQAAGRIAEGDLAVRVTPESASYPEVASLTASVNAMADRLERHRDQERQFLLSVSHDLRTPLTSIRGFAEALADGTATDTPKAAGVIAAEARRLERLVRDLLDMAKLDARQFALHPQPVDVAEVVADTAGGFAPTAEQLGLRLVVNEPGDRPSVIADPDRLAQVVANLIENACKYAASTIQVTTWNRGTAAVVTVDDDGPGIPPEDLPHVFDRLWTNPRAPARHVGSGLGLAIVAELVGAMGGTVRAESASGTRMVVTLSAGPPPGGRRLA